MRNYLRFCVRWDFPAIFLIQFIFIAELMQNKIHNWNFHLRTKKPDSFSLQIFKESNRLSEFINHASTFSYEYLLFAKSH